MLSSSCLPTLLQLSLSYSFQAPLYNCSLALYYLLVINSSWTLDKLEKIERQVHTVIILFTVGTSVAGLPLTMYNQVGNVCWVIGSPQQCGNSSHDPSDIPCDRGNGAWLFGIILFYGPLWVCVLLTIISMSMIYCKLRKTFRKNEQYRFSAVQTTSLDTNVHRRPVVGPSEAESAGRLSRFSMGSAKKADFSGEVSAALQQAHLEGAILDDSARIERMQVDLGPIADESADEISHEDLHEEGTNGHQGPSTMTPSNGRQGQKIAFSSDSRVENERTPSGWKSTRTKGSLKGKSQSKLTMFANQAILYSASFIVTWLPSTIWSVTHWFGVSGIGFDLAAATCEPLQGFWNLLIFIRSRPGSQAKLALVFGKFFCMCLNLLPKMPDEDDSGRNSSRQEDSERRGGNRAGSKAHPETSRFTLDDPISPSAWEGSESEIIPEMETKEFTRTYTARSQVTEVMVLDDAVLLSRGSIN